jgi:hypothetical protein
MRNGKADRVRPSANGWLMGVYDSVGGLALSLLMLTWAIALTEAMKKINGVKY